MFTVLLSCVHWYFYWASTSRLRADRCCKLLDAALFRKIVGLGNDDTCCQAVPCVCAWQVQKLLGKGSYGIVYRVKRLLDGRVYALKEIDVRKMSARTGADAVNEIRLLASVKHQNIIRYHEAFLDGMYPNPCLPASPLPSDACPCC